MDIEQNVINQIVGQLNHKACLKQENFRNIKKIFQMLYSEAGNIVKELSEKISDVDKLVHVEIKEVNKFEFHVKFSGDLLVFVMQTNIITFSDEYPIMQSSYIKEDRKRGYFGNIMIYNFMADSLKYQRHNDPGYLIARILVNHENHFYVEGVRQLNFLFTDIGHNTISKQWLRLLIEKAIFTAIDIDLIGTKYPDIPKVTGYEKINKNDLSDLGQKIGFQMSSDG